MYADVLQRIGLVKNEARIYETLLREGVSPVGQIAVKSRIHRRNVYDSLRRLVDRGYVFPILGARETSYQAAPPEKLLAQLDSKKQKLEQVLPKLNSLYRAQSPQHQVYVYRGPEGWKNYMRDHLRIAGVAHYISAKGAWLDERVKHFFPYFEEEARKRKMRYYHLFDYRVQFECPQVLPYVGKYYKFLPQKYSGVSSVDIFGDHVNLLPDIEIGRMGEEIRFTVIVNRTLADAFRTWFRLMWDICPEPEKG